MDGPRGVLATYPGLLVNHDVCALVIAGTGSISNGIRTESGLRLVAYDAHSVIMLSNVLLTIFGALCRDEPDFSRSACWFELHVH